MKIACAMSCLLDEENLAGVFKAEGFALLASCRRREGTKYTLSTRAGLWVAPATQWSRERLVGGGAAGLIRRTVGVYELPEGSSAAVTKVLQYIWEP